MPAIADIVVREARPDDAEGVVAILNPIIQAGTYTALDTPLTAEFERHYIAGFPERGIFHVAMEQQSSRLVGLQSIEPFADYTHAFDHVGVIGTFVDLAERRRGIGHRLFAQTVVVAKERGYEKFFSYVRADNQAALSFYLKLGFSVVGTAYCQARIGQAYVDEIIIEKFL